MTRRISLVTILSLLCALASCHIANAQAPGAPGGMPGGAAAPGAAGATVPATAGTTVNPTVDNSSTVAMGGGLSTFHGSSGAGVASTGAAADTGSAASGDTTKVANTGGEPWLMVLGGSLLAAAALAMRQRLGQSAR